MALPVPNLDDRRFQDLVDDAKRLVQEKCPEWTDHNVSDPGVTLIELFAWMTEQLIYRLNRVPDRNYVKFLELIGVSLLPPTAAHTDATFWLSGPQPDVVRIAAGTRIATLRTETDEAIVFATTEDLPIIPARVVQVGSKPKKKAPYEDHLSALELGDTVRCFQEEPAIDDTFLVGLPEAVPSNAVRLRFRCEIKGVGVHPDHPPLVWEVWDGEGWVPCERQSDTTGGLNRDGDVIIHVPKGHTAHEIAGRRAGWIQARVVTPDPGFPPYQSSPRVGAVSAITIGGTVEAVNAVTVTDEDLGVAEGVPGQRFQLRRGPVLAGDQPAVLAVQVGVDAKGDPIHETWQQVEHFSDSRPDDRHFVLDSSAGEIRLGPAVRLEDGSLRRYGATPLKGQRLRMVEYRTGGGRHGNLAAGALTVMKSSIPFVARVENRRDATGGVDGEDIESAKVRGPIRLRTRGRAVTTEDYEQLAREAAPDVGRVRAVAGGDGAEVGAVRVLIVPRVPSQDGRLEFARMFPDPQLVETITSRLEECRVIGARVLVGRPSYEGVTVVASVTPATGVNPDRLKADTTRALYEYLHPLIGGPDGDGWPFGRPVSVGEVYSILQKVTGVDVVEGIELYRAIAETGERKEQVQRLELGTHTLIFSVDHQVGVPGAD